LTWLGVVIALDLNQEDDWTNVFYSVGCCRSEYLASRSRHFRFLKDARCSVRIVEVRLFKTGRLSDRVPEDRRRWQPGGDLTETAKEISKYITNSGSAEATIVASDEL
jgi:hypothetical protein